MRSATERPLNKRSRETPREEKQSERETETQHQTECRATEEPSDGLSQHRQGNRTDHAEDDGPLPGSAEEK